MRSNRWLKRVLWSLLVFGLIVLGVLTIYWVTLNRYAGGLAYYLSLPSLVGMLSLPVSLIAVAGTGLLTLVLHERAEQNNRPMNSIYGIREFLGHSTEILSSWLEDAGGKGDDRELLVVLPMLAFGRVEEARKSSGHLGEQVDQFEILLHKVMADDNGGRVRLVTNSPFPFGNRAEPALLRFLRGILSSPDEWRLLPSVYKRAVDLLRKIIEEVRGERKSLILVDSLNFACISLTMPPEKGVWIYQLLDTNDASGIETSNPNAVGLMRSLAETQVTASAKVDLLSETSPASRSRFVGRLVEHYREALDLANEQDLGGVADRIAESAARKLNVARVLALPEEWRQAESWRNSYREFRFGAREGRGDVLSICLPSLSGFDPSGRPFYKRLMEELAKGSDVLMLDFPGCSGVGVFSVEDAQQAFVATVHRELDGRTDREIVVFGSCTGFLVGVLGLLDLNVKSIKRFYGWHAPEVMRFNQERVGRFQCSFGVSARVNDLGTFAPPSLVEQLRSQRKDLRIAVGRGHQFLEDEPSVSYLHIPGPGAQDFFPCKAHMPQLHEDALNSLAVRVASFLLEEEEEGVEE